MTQVKRRTSGAPPDGGWGWMVVVGAAMGGFCMVGIAKSFGVVADEIKTYFEAPQYKVALIFGLAAVIYTVAGPISLILGEQFTQRKIVMLGGVIGTLGLSLSSVCVSLEYVIATFGVGFGLCNGFLYGNCLVMVGKYFKNRRSLANGLAMAGSSVGQFALPPLIQFFINTYTIKGALLLLGGVYLHILVIGALFRPLSLHNIISADNIEENGESISNKNGDLALEADKSVNEQIPMVVVSDAAENKNCHQTTDLSERETFKTPSASLIDVQENQRDKERPFCGKKCNIPKLIDFSVLKNPICLLLAFSNFFMFFGHFNFILYLPTIAFDRGVEQYQKAYLVSISGICDLVGRLVCGFVSDLNIVKRYKIFSWSIIVVGTDIIVFVWAYVYWQMCLQSAIYGFFGGAYVTLISLVIIDFVGIQLLPRVLAPVLFVQGIGAAVGQVFLGWVRDETGNFTAMLLICGVCNLIGGFSLLMYPIIKKLDRGHTLKTENHSQ